MHTFTVSTQQYSNVRRRLLAWYRRAGRDLPWRHTHDPYKILVSEIMLQQTQVGTVIKRYLRWLKRFPTVHALAKASPAMVLKEWSGLGYNRRALALHNIAKRVVTDYAGKFPTDITELQTFNGIGEYTAHAIANFAYRQPVPLVDTNIKRVLGRIFFGYKQLAKLRDDTGIFWTLSQKFIGSSRSVYDLNQGLMDFGALVCTAKQPKCLSCPLRTQCKSYPDILQAEAEQLRVKTKRSEPLYYGQPRRIWRGRILQLLHDQPAGMSLSAIGQQLQTDWDASRLPWLNEVINTMVEDHLVQRARQYIRVAL